jgi:Family of unknown function (DUF6962)
MYFSEPVTALTDYALGAASLYFAIALQQKKLPKSRSIHLWSLGFFSSAAAAFIGGTFHALKFHVSDWVLNLLWNLTIVSIGASGAFMGSGVMVSSIHRHHKSRPWLWGGVWVTAAGSLIQQTRIPLHNDIFHCTQILALYLFFSGARLLEDRVPPG